MTTLGAAAVLVVALTIGHAGLAQRASRAMRLVRASSLADAAARQAASGQGEAALAQMAEKHAPLLAAVAVVASHGAGEPDILFATSPGTAAVRGALVDAAKSRLAVAADALAHQHPMDGADLIATLPDGAQAIVQPFRALPNKPELGGAVALVLRPEQLPETPVLVWFLPVLAALGSLVARGPLADRLAPTAALAVIAAACVLLLPVLPTSVSSGVQLLADAWLVPHTAVAHARVPGTSWLLCGALILTLILGPMVASIAAVASVVQRSRAPAADKG